MIPIEYGRLIITSVDLGDDSPEFPITYTCAREPGEPAAVFTELVKDVLDEKNKRKEITADEAIDFLSAALLVWSQKGVDYPMGSRENVEDLHQSMENAYGVGDHYIRLLAIQLAGRIRQASFDRKKKSEPQKVESGNGSKKTKAKV